MAKVNARKIDNVKHLYKSPKGKTSNAILKISVRDKLGKIDNYNIPVIEVTRAHVKRRNKHSILSKKIVPVRKNGYWEIVNLRGHTLNPAGLKNRQIVLINGKKRISGIVVEVAMTGGGATSPPIGGDLPPIDE